MIDALLSTLVVVLVPFGWISTVILARAARRPPRIGALTERAWIAAAIAVMLTSAALLTINRTQGYVLFPIDVARVIFSVSVLVLAFVPVGWCVLWFRGDLGDKP